MTRSQEPVLLTGATGFIGRRLQTILTRQGRKVRALIRPGSLNRDALLPQVEVIEGNLNDAQTLSRAVSGISAAVYAAGSVRGRNAVDFAAANVDGVRCMVEAINLAEPETPLLLMSSLAASRPSLSDYSRSKFLGEEQLKQRSTRPWSIIRPSAVYGPGDKEMLPLLKLARSGWAVQPGPDGQRVNLIHADDLCAAACAWLDHWQACRSQTYTLDDGQAGGYTWRQIVESAGASTFHRIQVPQSLLRASAWTNLAVSAVTRHFTGNQPMLTPGKVNELTQSSWLCDNEPFCRATGWRPQISLIEGIQLTLENSDNG